MMYLHREEGKIGFQDRMERYGQKPFIFWFTGLSGAGKTTIAVEFEKMLFDLGNAVFHLDADDLRNRLNKDLGFSIEERIENIRRASEVARILQDAGLIVLATFITPTEASRQTARSAAREGLFAEVFVSAPLETCIKRDPKGFYKKAAEGDIKNYTGIKSRYEEPQHPDILLETDKNDINACVQTLLDFSVMKEIIK